MTRTYGVRPPKRTFITGGLDSIPPGTMMVPSEVKSQYELIPFHIYHPSPHDAITILRSKKNQHDWLVCGWYVDTYRQDGQVKGLLYRPVASEPDKEAVIAELKRRDKEAVPRFSL